LSLHPKNAEAVIEDTLDAIEVGDRAVAYAPPVLIQTKDAPLRTDTLEPIKLGATATIVHGRNGATHLGAGSLLLLDRGANAGLKVGDVLLALRDKRMEPGSRNKAKTNRYLGQLLVVRVSETSCTCLVLASKSEMRLGDVATK
jgi:hypothetical protein